MASANMAQPLLMAFLHVGRHCAEVDVKDFARAGLPFSSNTTVCIGLSCAVPHMRRIQSIGNSIKQTSDTQKTKLLKAGQKRGL